MAFCNKCGEPIQPGERFCGNCGTPVAPAAAPTVVPVVPPVPETPAQNTESFDGMFRQENTYRSPEDAYQTRQESFQRQPDPFAQQNSYQRQEAYGAPYVQGGYGSRNPYGGGAAPVQKMLKEFGGSILFLVNLCVIALVIVLSVIAGGSGGIVILLGQVPMILTVIGLILAFVDCRSAQPVPKGSGIGCYKAGKIVMIVYIAILAAIVVIALCVGGAMMSGFSSMYGGDLYDLFDSAGYGYEYGVGTSVMSGIMIAMIVIIAAIILLAILTMTKLMKTANIVRDSLRSGRPAGIIPIFPAVIFIILAVFTAISVFSMIGMSAMYGSALSVIGVSFGSSGISIFSSLLSLVQLILGAVLIIQLRGRMNALRESRY